MNNTVVMQLIKYLIYLYRIFNYGYILSLFEDLINDLNILFKNK